MYQQFNRGYQNQGFNQGFQNNVNQIHQRTMQSGMMAQPQYSNSQYSNNQGGYGGNSMMSGSSAQQSVNQNQLDRIHQSSMQNGMMAQPQYSNSQGGYGNFGGQQYNQGYNNS
ncbi:MAG: hypothetical protein ACXVDJ_09685, partial [Tumebacillaceae bacterium]